MKRYYVLLIFVIAFLSECFSQTSTYYYYKGQKVNVVIDEEHYYVVLSDTLDWTDTNLSRQYALSSTQGGVQLADNQKEYWKIIQVKKMDAKTNGKIRASDLLDTNPKMKYVGPVLKYDYPLAVSELFYIKLKSSDDFAYLQSIAEDTHCEIIGGVSYMPLWYTLKVPTGKDALSMTNTFYETGHFEDVDPGFIFNFQTQCTNDPLFASQWGLRNSNGLDIKACDAWNLTRGNASVIVAVVDQGIESSHSDFASNLLSSSYDALTNTSPARLYYDGKDFPGHGTHVAGIIGANQNNLFISGVAPQTSLMAISHNLLCDATSSQEMASGISWAWQHGAAIINNSWGDQGGRLYPQMHSTLLEDAIQNALTQGRGGKGCVVVFASGNKAPKIDYPANSNSDILCVGSINSSGHRSNFSAYGAALDVVAPGEHILSTLPINRADYMDGTSMACPHVAGVAALVLAANSSLTGAQVTNIIESTTQKVGGYFYSANSIRPNGTWNNEMGYGLVDAYAAVQRALDNDVNPPKLLPGSHYQFRHPSGQAATWSISGSGLSNISINASTGLLTNHNPKYSGTITVKGVNASSTYTRNVTIGGEFIQGRYQIGATQHTFSEWYPPYPVYPLGLNINEPFTIYITSPTSIEGKATQMSWKRTDGNLTFNGSGSSLNVNPAGTWGRILLEVETQYGTLEQLFCINVGGPANLSVTYTDDRIKISDQAAQTGKPTPYLPDPATESVPDKNTLSANTYHSYVYEIVNMTEKTGGISGRFVIKTGESKEIDISTLPGGYYILSITDGQKKIYTEKFFK